MELTKNQNIDFYQVRLRKVIKSFEAIASNKSVTSIKNATHGLICIAGKESGLRMTSHIITQCCHSKEIADQVNDFAKDAALYKTSYWCVSNNFRIQTSTVKEVSAVHLPVPNDNKFHESLLPGIQMRICETEQEAEKFALFAEKEYNEVDLAI